MNTYEPLEWNTSFDVGVEEIDEQHHILVNTINEAAVTLSENSTLDALEQITNNLLSYALYHFETEEELMIQYGYNDLCKEDADAHLKRHRDFSATVVNMRNNIKANKTISKDELLTFLKDWLTNHILNTDKKLGAYIVAKRAS